MFLLFDDGKDVSYNTPAKIKNKELFNRKERYGQF